MPFREELWNSELFATAEELAGLCRGEGEGQAEFSALRPAWHSSQRGCGDKCRPIFHRMGRLIAGFCQIRKIHAVTVIQQAEVSFPVSASIKMEMRRTHA